MPKRKGKKVSLEPILQDCNITSASNIDFSGATYPSDESFENRFGNRDISYCDLNKSPNCSSNLQKDKNCEDFESLKVGSKVPFSSNNIKRCRPSLFDSIVINSEPTTPERDVKSERLKKRCLQKDGKIPHSSSKQQNDENREVVQSPLVGFKVPFSSKNTKKCRPSLFDSIINDSEPATPESDVKSERFKKKCLQKADISFSISSTDNSIVEANNSLHCRKSTIVNYKGKNVAAHISKMFESDLECSDTTHNISHLNDPNEEENSDRHENITRRKGRTNASSLSKFSIKPKISTMEEIADGTFDSIFSESNESNLGLETTSNLTKGAEMLLEDQKSKHDESSNNISNRQPPRIPFARAKNTQDHVNGDFDSDLDQSNISAQSNIQARQSVFHDDLSNKNAVQVNSNIFESDLDSSETSIHCSRKNEDMDSFANDRSNNSPNTKSSCKPLLVEAETNCSKHSDAFEGVVEALNTSLQSTSRVVENQLDDFDTPSKTVLNNTNNSKKSDILDSNISHSDASDVYTINGGAFTIQNHKHSKLDEYPGSENYVESKGQDLTNELNSLDENSHVQAQNICGEGTAEISEPTEQSGTYGNEQESANNSVQKLGVHGQEFDIVNRDKQENNNLLDNNDNSRASDIMGSNLKECDNIFSTAHFEPFSEKDQTLNLHLESSGPSNEFCGSYTSAVNSKYPLTTDKVQDRNVNVQAVLEEKSINDAESNYFKSMRGSIRKSSLAIRGVSLGKRVSFKIDERDLMVDEQNSSLMITQCSKVSHLEVSKNNLSCSLGPLLYESSSEMLNSDSVVLDINASSSRNIGSSVSSCNENIQTSKIPNVDENESEDYSKIDEMSGDCENTGESERSIVNSGIDIDTEEISRNKTGEQEQMDRIEYCDEDSENYEDSAAQNDDASIEDITDSNVDSSKDLSSSIGSAVNSNIGGEDQEDCENNTEDQSEMENSQIIEENYELSSENENNDEDGENNILSEVDDMNEQHANNSSKSHSDSNVSINSDSEHYGNYNDDQEFHSNNNMMPSFRKPAKEPYGRSLKGREDLSERKHSNREDSSKYKNKGLNSHTQDPGKISPAKNNVFDEYGSYLQAILDEENPIPHTSRQYDTFIFKTPHPKKLSKKRTKNILKNVPFSELKSKKRRASGTNREQTLHNEIEKSVENRKCKEPTSAKIYNATLKKPKKWVTSRMYEFLIKKLKPKHGVHSRVEAEKLVFYLAKQVDRILKIKDLSFYAVVEEMKSKLAGLRVIETHFEFRDFVMNHFDGTFIHKVYPSGGAVCNPYEPKNMFDVISI